MGTDTTIAQAQEEKVILFDGVCNLCNASVNFVIDRDPDMQFRFASLQSDFGQEKLKALGKRTDEYSSIVLMDGDRVYERSTAALRVARRLKGAWPLLYAFIVIPPFIRNFVYDFIAKNRYRWFGQEDACRLPSPELKARFLDA